MLEAIERLLADPDLGLTVNSQIDHVVTPWKDGVATEFFIFPTDPNWCKKKRERAEAFEEVGRELMRNGGAWLLERLPDDHVEESGCVESAGRRGGLDGGE